ncbi:hypothetical protein CBR_g23361 [Chara braunii]|uniref:Uncharacterized protein n=1 Tax=Chara braunii TaxID=69332 RepID=A0A388L400_CHABU|nr:hypothetical protein CBR_g23361 [Chara braunii]|eukprot:GBG77035.1 hypothetical protein CBR_g23361 [Chara braunii]
MREFSEYLVDLTDVEPLPFADEDVWELHRALYKSVALGMFWFFVDHEDHAIGEHFVVYYVIARPKPAEKEGTVALHPFAQLQTIDSGLLELLHLELLSIAQVIASEEEEIQPRLRTVTAPRRTYNAVVIPDYIAQRAERLEDFPEERPLRPPSSYPRPAPPKGPKKTPKRKRRHPSPGAQGSRIGGDKEVIQPARTRIPDPVPGSAATLVKETIVPSPPIPRVPDLNLDGAGPSAAAAAGGGSRMGFPDPISRPPVLAGPLRNAGSCPCSSRNSDRLISLPTFPITDDDNVNCDADVRRALRRTEQVCSQDPPRACEIRGNGFVLIDRFDSLTLI